MGGDGGVIAANRRYMQGAGQADSTGDYAKTSKVHQSPSEIMAICSLTGAPLPFPIPNKNKSKIANVVSSQIVCCPYGKLYGKEAAIEALLRNKNDVWDVQSMKELYPVRFHFVKTINHDKYIPSCPVTGTELNGTQPCFVIASNSNSSNKKDKKKKNDDVDDNINNTRVNVLSQQAIREIGIETLQEEYGPFKEEELIRLAPSDREMESIKLQVQSRRKQREIEDKKRKEKRKRKEAKQNDITDSSNSKKKSKNNYSATTPKSITTSVSSIPSAIGTVQTAKCSVAMAVASNSVLSSLFDNENSSRIMNLSDKEKKDNLFAR